MSRQKKHIYPGYRRPLVGTHIENCIHTFSPAAPNALLLGFTSLVGLVDRGVADFHHVAETVLSGRVGVTL